MIAKHSLWPKLAGSTVLPNCGQRAIGWLRRGAWPNLGRRFNRDAPENGLRRAGRDTTRRIDGEAHRRRRGQGLVREGRRTSAAVSEERPHHRHPDQAAAVIAGKAWQG